MINRLPPPPFVLLDDSKSRNRTNAGLLFQDPIEIIECRSLENVGRTIRAIERATGKGKWVAGWISYECGYALHPTLQMKKQKLSDEPLIWLGVFNSPRLLSSRDLNGLFMAGENGLSDSLKTIESRLQETEKEFGKRFETIQKYISAGDVYQVNHTFRQTLKGFSGAQTLYGKLRKSQPVHHGAFIRTGSWDVLSLSPELFLEKKGQTIRTRPMKGTAGKGLTWEDLAANREALKKDPKNRAENLMITDLMRNDLSRVCKHGSVRIKSLFEVETYATLLQMTTEIRGRVSSKEPFSGIFEALFPCGSITGAPKIRAMEIIRETEKHPRGIYTGAIGYWMPGGDFSLNVAIRTVVASRNGQAWCGVGSGLVADSSEKEEYRECRLKTRFLQKEAPTFALIETMRRNEDGKFAFEKEHLDRLEKSAGYFDFCFDRKKIREILRATQRSSMDPYIYKVRLLLNKNGEASVETVRFEKEAPTETVVLAFADRRLDCENPFLFHKTTYRPFYENVFKENTSQETPFDFIFENRGGFVTEGTFNSLFIRKRAGGPLLTPALSCGLLPGILRGNLIKKGKAQEAFLTRTDILNAREIWAGNSVRGLLRAEIKRPKN